MRFKKANFMHFKNTIFKRFMLNQISLIIYKIVILNET
jgi:hypothetical protein